MKLAALIALSCLIPASIPEANARPSSASCQETGIETIGDLNAVLSRRAVEIIKLASQPGNDARLKQLIAPGATFSLGAGDVGRPMGESVAGARAMASDMHADRYRFDLWSTIPAPIDDPCGKHTVTVEFIDSTKDDSYPVKFTFVSGLLIDASGWARWFESGSMDKPEAPSSLP